MPKTPPAPAPAPAPEPVTLAQARAAKRRARTVLAGLPGGDALGVAGVGITQRGSDYAVKLNLHAPPPAGLTLPACIDGVALCVEVVGMLRKQTPSSRR